MKRTDAQALVRGNRVATQLGWPGRHQGLFGAASSLLEPFANFKTPHTSMKLAYYYSLKSQLATARRINESAARIAEISRR